MSIRALGRPARRARRGPVPGAAGRRTPWRGMHGRDRAPGQRARSRRRTVSSSQLYLAFGELGRGDARAALAAARTARDSFRRQGRAVATARAELVVLSARRRTGARGARSPRAPSSWPTGSRRRGPRTHRSRGCSPAGPRPTPGGTTRRSCGRRPPATAAIPSGLVRATAWLAEALDRDQRDELRGVWHACRRGLDALDDHRATLGSTELRALASARGDELARLAQARAVHAGPRTQLWWSERWRGTLAQPATRSPRDRELAGLLAALRANDRRLSEARDDDESTSMLERERARLEKAIQHRRRLVGVTNGTAAGPGRRRRGPAGRRGRRRDVRGAVRGRRSAAVGRRHRWPGPGLRRGERRGRRRGGRLGAVRAAAGGAWPAGPARRHPGSPPGALLGPSVAAFGTGPVVVSPTASLHATPWGLLPALAGVPVTVVPTASAWLRARGSQLAGTAGCSLPVRGWHRGERRSRWWPRSTRRPWC